MYKFIIGFLFLFLDMTINDGTTETAASFQFDLFPDFVGYAILLYGIWRVRKEHSDSEGLMQSSRQIMWYTAIAMVVTYVICMLGIYGIILKAPEIVGTLFTLTLDVLMLIMVFMYIQLLRILQGRKILFQVKRLEVLMKFDFICIAFWYLAMQMGTYEMMVSLYMFEKIIELIILVYVVTSAKNYKNLRSKL